MLLKALTLNIYIYKLQLEKDKPCKHTNHKKSKVARNIVYYLSTFYLTDVQLILIICELHICEFTSWTKFICNPQIKSLRTFMVICGHVQNGEKF